MRGLRPAAGNSAKRKGTSSNTLPAHPRCQPAHPVGRPAGSAALADVTGAEELLSAVEDYPATEDGRRARRRHRICRALVEDPVLYVEDLAADERDTYRSQRHRLEPELEALTGLAAERRAEGSALVDPLNARTTLQYDAAGNPTGGYGAVTSAAPPEVPPLLRP